MLRKFGFNVGYMAWQVAIKGTISAPFWVLGWMLSESQSGSEDIMGIIVVSGFVIVVAMAFGWVIGVGIGALVGVIYAIFNGLAHIIRLSQSVYRPLLATIGTGIGMVLFLFLLDYRYGDLTTFTGGMLAGLGVAVSTITYLDSYQHRFGSVAR